MARVCMVYWGFVALLALLHHALTGTSFHDALLSMCLQSLVHMRHIISKATLVFNVNSAYRLLGGLPVHLLSATLDGGGVF